MGDSEKEVGKLHLSMSGQKDWFNEIPFCMMERKIKLKPPTEMGTQCTQQDDTLTFYVRCGEEVPAMHIVAMTLQGKIDKEFAGHPCLLCVCLSLKLQNWLGDKSEYLRVFLLFHVISSTSHCHWLHISLSSQRMLLSRGMAVEHPFEWRKAEQRFPLSKCWAPPMGASKSRYILPVMSQYICHCNVVVHMLNV